MKVPPAASAQGETENETAPYSSASRWPTNSRPRRSRVKATLKRGAAYSTPKAT